MNLCGYTIIEYQATNTYYIYIGKNQFGIGWTESNGEL